MTLFASFNLPRHIAPSLPDSMDTVISRLSFAQIVTPAAMQAFGTPLHLFALDLYNRNGRLTWRHRVQMVRTNWVSATLARMCRIIPAYGFGGVVNMKVRTRLMERYAD